MRENRRFCNITIFQANPLIYLNKTYNKKVPIERLDLNWEKKLVDHTLKTAIEDTGKRIDVKFSGCSSFDVSSTLSRGKNSVLHFSMHGRSNPTAAYFEDGRGGLHLFGQNQPDEIQRLFKEHGDSVKLVVLSMCDSEAMAREILKAGIEHIICCKNKKQLNDQASIKFAQQFYNNIASGHTLQKSFNDACSNVKLSDHLVLLPDDMGENHHEVDIFFEEKAEETPELFPNPLEFKCPPQPEYFVGRNLQMYDTLQIKDKNRLVQITGPDGIGKSSLAKAVCKYIYDRPLQFLIKPIIWLDQKTNRTQYSKPFCKLTRLFEALQSEDNIVDYCNEISEALVGQQALLVLDCRKLESSAMKKLGSLVSILFKKTESNRVIVICAPEGSISDKYSRVELPNLTFENSAKLFARTLFSRDPDFLRDCSIVNSSKELCSLLVPEVEKRETNVHDFMSKRCKQIFRSIGGGNPKEIQEKAVSMKKGEFDKLIRLGEKPEFQSRLNSRHILELDIVKNKEEFENAKKHNDPQKMEDYNSIVKELEKFRSKFRTQTELAEEAEKLARELAIEMKKENWGQASKIKNYLCKQIQPRLDFEKKINSTVEKYAGQVPKETMVGIGSSQSSTLRKKNEKLEEEIKKVRIELEKIQSHVLNAKQRSVWKLFLLIITISVALLRSMLNSSVHASQVQPAPILIVCLLIMFIMELYQLWLLNDCKSIPSSTALLQVNKDPKVQKPSKSHRGKSPFQLIISKHLSIIDFSYGTSNDKYGIVCATNEMCFPFCGGVDLALAKAGGKRLDEDRRNLEGKASKLGGVKRIIRCITGNAQIVGPNVADGDGKLKYDKVKANYVIFAVGPTYLPRGAGSEKDILLRGAYRSSLSRAKEKKLEAVGFSLISAGNRCGGNLERPLRIALEELSAFQGYKELKQINICAFNEDEVEMLDKIVHDHEGFRNRIQFETASAKREKIEKCFSFRNCWGSNKSLMN